jgi:aspartate 4-decarboxylase
MLNAGHGNPNWIAIRPRAAFFLLGEFALGEGRRAWEEEDLIGGMPAAAGIARRFEAFLAARAAAPGVAFLRDALAYGVAQCGFNADAWICELADAIVGGHYPEPGRMLAHVERIVRDYLMKELCDGRPPKGRFDLFAVEGGTAAMCYVFDTRVQNGLLKRGDTIALLVPTFTPYIEIPELERYAFRVVRVEASATTPDRIGGSWWYPKEELAKLASPRARMAFVVNPSNPTSVALGSAELRQIAGIVRHGNPALMLVTDDVYGTFVPNFRSLMAEVPRNTICVYSFSENFGSTGWRLGVIAVHHDNVFDRKLAALPAARKKALRKRCATVTLAPDDPLCACYYADIDFMAWAHPQHGEEFCAYMRANYEPVAGSASTSSACLSA